MTRRRLAVRLDQIANLRQQRRATFPDPATAAAHAETAGASGIVVHLREDRRHIQERDLRVLRQTVQTSLALEMSPAQEMLKIAYDIKPDSVTLVPEQRDERTTERGLDVTRDRDHLRKFLQGLRDADIEPRLLIEPDLDQLKVVHKLDVGLVELHCGKYAEARGEIERRAELQRLVDGARAATKLGMRVSVSHGLNYQNVAALALIEDVDLFAVGHAIVAHSLWTGMERAVRDMLELLSS